MEAYLYFMLLFINACCVIAIIMFNNRVINDIYRRMDILALDNRRLQAKIDKLEKRQGGCK